MTSPTVVIDESRARANIATMAAKARAADVVFRPHFKTHQNTGIARWFADEGVDRIAVSSLAMAEYFAEAGWNDITLAFLINPLEFPRLRKLAAELRRRSGSLGVTIDSVAAAKLLADGDEIPEAVWIKVDTGYGRTGVRWNQAEQLIAIVDELDPDHPPVGLLTHSGLTYEARGSDQVTAIHRETIQRMIAAKATLNSERGLGDLLLSIGDTPSCSLVDCFDNVDEIRPGNFVFYDLMQREIGSCGSQQLAAGVACPVVGIYPDRSQIVVHGGAVHLSKESLEAPGGGRIYGRLGIVGKNGAPDSGRILNDTALVALSQEHGVVEMERAVFSSLTRGLEIGDLVFVWPIHSCLTCDLHTEFITLSGRLIGSAHRNS